MSVADFEKADAGERETLPTASDLPGLGARLNLAWLLAAIWSVSLGYSMLAINCLPYKPLFSLIESQSVVVDS